MVVSNCQSVTENLWMSVCHWEPVNVSLSLKTCECQVCHWEPVNVKSVTENLRMSVCHWEPVNVKSVTENLWIIPVDHSSLRVTHLWRSLVAVGHSSLEITRRWGSLISGDHSSLWVIRPWGSFIPGHHSSLGVIHSWKLLIPGDRWYGKLYQFIPVNRARSCLYGSRFSSTQWRSQTQAHPGPGFSYEHGRFPKRIWLILIYLTEKNVNSNKKS